MSKRRRRKRQHVRSFPGEGELDENGNTPCVLCGGLIPVWEDYPDWKERMEHHYLGEPVETLAELVADCKAVCDECGKDF